MISYITFLLSLERTENPSAFVTSIDHEESEVGQAGVQKASAAPDSPHSAGNAGREKTATQTKKSPPSVGLSRGEF